MSRRFAGAGLRRNVRMQGARRSRLAEPTYYASGWTDADFFVGATGQGPGTLGTVRLVGVLLSVPVSTTRVIAGRPDSTGSSRGWYIGTGLGAAGDIGLVAAGAAGAQSPHFAFSPSDVGKLFVLHGTVDAADVRLYMGGTEVGAGTAIAGAPTAAASTDLYRIGRFPSAGFACPHVGVVSICTATATVMDAASIADDAAAIMARPSHLSFPALPGEDARHVAADLVSVTDWHDRTGDDATLTRNGTITLTEVT